METCGVVDDSRETSHTSRHNLIGHQKDGKGDGIKEKTKGYKQIVFDLIPYQFVINRHRWIYNLQNYLPSTMLTIRFGTMITFFT